MTSNQQKLIELTKKYETTRDFMKSLSAELNAAVDAVAKETGVNVFFQDHDGTVFRIAKAKGTYVEYRDLIYQRTRRNPKEKPGITLKEARDAGYTVE